MENFMLNAIKKNTGDLSLKKQNLSFHSEQRKILFFENSLRDAIMACQPKKLQHQMYK
jgi:hypothetical protein